MAEIDKSLPNVRQEINLDTEEAVVEAEKETEQALEEKPPVDVQQNEDGSVDINFEPSAMNPGQDSGHFANLAELLPDDVLGRLSSVLMNNYRDYKMSRKEWEKSYTSGLDLLGFKYDSRTEPFRGASGATHPVLAEAVTQFQALAYKELLPADGPVRTQILGVQDPVKEQQARRVKDFMNYEIMNNITDYEPDFDQLLFYLPLAGSAFKKVYYDEVEGKAVSKFVPADDLVVPYSATTLEEAESIIHVVRMSENDLRKQQVNGFYRDIELMPGPMNETDAEKKERELSGERKTKEGNVFTLLEVHTELDLEGFEDVSVEGEPTGIKIPYIVTIEEASGQVLSIRRNFEIGDIKKKRISYFVHFKFLPGLGFYGFGLIHMIGGLSRTATAALRQLLDAGTLSNLPAGFKQRGIRIRDDAQSIQPGEFRDVDAPGGNIRDAFMMLPYKEPSQTLLNLMGVVVQAGQRFASIADLQVGDGNQGAAVGTTVALLERGSRVMSAIHKRLYASLKVEFNLLARVFKLYLPAEYPYDVVGGQRVIKQADFDDRVDILPVADPNIFSQTQRISLAQTEMQLAQSNPNIHNMYQVYRHMYEALGVKNIDAILKPPPIPVPKDPALEHIDAIGAVPFQAFPGQDHRAHITSHLNFMATNMARNAPIVMAALEKNILEHISIMAQEQIQLEFKTELQELMMMQQNPQAMINPEMQMQVKMLTEKIESRKAVLIAEMMDEFMKEEKKITSQFDNDPIAKLRSRELDLRARDDERKRMEGEEKINLDKMRAMMNQMNVEEKREQNEELAKLRANTSIQKTILSKTIPSTDSIPSNISIIRKED
ncbi:MAG: hypothetical protein CBD16_00105 [Betaproteobacteria bacterium TMED156]|jgi:hypothetical protein|nr:MAG: hypothetical protein CBD16_00105 [Betaproteobacteria bacterium TMED156]